MKVSHISSFSTELTCNCLLSSRSTTHLYAACYAHTKASTKEDHDTYCGALTDYAVSSYAALGQGRTCKMETQPGIFDICWWDNPPPSITSLAAATLLCCCTDGSVRLVNPADLTSTQTFAGIHSEMLTSVTPYTTEGDSLLCTAHTGAALVYDLAEQKVKYELEGHEFDAWCSAVSTRLLTGGDDGLVKFYDVRASTSAMAKMRFGAGVVSITPVTEGGQTGSFVLVGSYDESLSLVDVRQTRRPVATVEQMGGGVWRCRSALEPSSRFGTVSAKGTLVLPLMQRGPAAIAYDISQPEVSVFGEPFYFYSDAEVAVEDGCLLPPLSENCLVYDTAVVSSHKDEEDEASTVATIATCSFYEKKIDLWSLKVQ